MRQGTSQTLEPTRGVGFLRDMAGAQIFSRRRALTPPASFAGLAVGMQVAFEPASGPKGPRAARVTVAPPAASLAALAAYFHSHAAS